MDAERWRRVEELYHATLKRRPSERGAFLATACSGDVALRDEIESLLAQQSDSLLDKPAWQQAPSLVGGGVSMLTAGTRLGPYEIEAPIGAGGMGEVYRARDTRLQRKVAIKILPAHLSSNPHLRARFEQEAKSISRLQHPNICVVHDIGSQDGVDFMVMEYVAGKTLGELIPEGGLATEVAIKYAVQIAEALARAHAAGIVHRDLKPANIMVDESGIVKVLDFGLAKLAAPASALNGEDATGTMPMLTTPGMIVGTVAYMSPEQVRGQPVDHRSDLFSLGCVLFEMVTGARAFGRTSAADTMSAILNADPAGTLAADARIPAALARTIQHCLEKNPDERFQSAKDLAFDLGGTPRSAKMPASAASQAPARRRKALAAAVAAALIIVASLWAASLWWAVTRPARASLIFRPMTFRRGIVASARFVADGQNVVYAASWDGQPLDIFSVDPRSPESRSLGFAPACLFAIARTNEMAISVGCRFQNSFITTGTLATIPLNGRAPKELRENVAFADWTPDGQQLALTTSDSPRRLEFPPGHVLFTASGTGWPGPVRISPKGDRIAFVEHNYFGGDGTITVLDLNGRITAKSEKFGLIEALAWSPDGREVWFTGRKLSEDASLYAMNLAGKVRLLLRIPGALMLYDIRRDGKMLLGRTDDRDSVEFLGPTEETSRDMSWLDWTNLDDLSDDGLTLAFEESGSGVAPEEDVAYIRKTDGSPAVRIGSKWRGQALSPDGKWLFAVQEQDRNQSGFMLLPIRAGSSMRVETGLQLIGRAAWFPDNRRVVFAANAKGHQPRTYVQEIGSGSPRPVTPEGEEFVAFSRDTSEVLASGPNGFSIYAVDGGRARSVPFLGPQDDVAGFAAGGKALYLRVRPDLSRVFRMDLASGQRELWKLIRVSNPTGFRRFGPMRITPDGKFIAFGLQRTILQVVSGGGASLSGKAPPLGYNHRHITSWMPSAGAGLRNCITPH
jgi:Tol biopolymer transport system component/predicted Ser/Thr protein kinase